MDRPTYTRQRGETILIGVCDDGAVNGGETLVSAHLRAIPRNMDAPLADAPIAASCVVSYRPADTNFPVGWTLTVDATDSLELTAGLYQADTRITNGSGFVFVSDPAFVRIVEPATL